MSLYNLSQTSQFKTTEPAPATGSEQCVSCNQPITARYYRVNTRIACEACAQAFERQQPKDSHAAYVRGLLFGIGAAILGMIGYAAFTILTGLYIGYVSLAVGWLVGKAIMLGSRGYGGRRYQIAAVALTYAAVSMAAIPIAISYQLKSESASKQAAQQLRSTNSESTQPESAPKKPAMSFGAAILQLLLIGLASPFLELADPFHGLIGLVILMVGIQIAWKLTKGSTHANIDGPFDISAAATV